MMFLQATFVMGHIVVFLRVGFWVFTVGVFYPCNSCRAFHPYA